MDYRGLIIFAVGGTILLLVLTDILQKAGSSYNSSLFPDTVIGGFIGFLLVGYGLFVNTKSAKMETKSNPSS